MINYVSKESNFILFANMVIFLIVIMYRVQSWLVYSNNMSINIYIITLSIEIGIYYKQQILSYPFGKAILCCNENISTAL